jgi:hypothetical protein
MMGFLHKKRNEWSNANGGAGVLSVIAESKNETFVGSGIINPSTIDQSSNGATSVLKY